MDLCINLGGERAKNGKCSLTQKDITFEYNVDTEGIEKGLFGESKHELILPQIADIISINGNDIGYINGFKEKDTAFIYEMEILPKFRNKKIGLASIIAYVNDPPVSNNLSLYMPQKRHKSMWSQLGDVYDEKKDGYKIKLYKDLSKFHLNNIL